MENMNLIKWTKKEAIEFKSNENKTKQKNSNNKKNNLTNTSSQRWRINLSRIYTLNKVDKF